MIWTDSRASPYCTMAWTMTGKGIRGAGCLWLCALVLALPAEGADHQLDFSSRVRAVHVDETEGHGKAASALLRVNLTSQWHRQWLTLLEVDHVGTAWNQAHSNGARINDRPMIPDVPGTEINRAQLGFRTLDGEVIVGRQRIEHDDQRFVGSVNFWQNEQTFDAATVNWALLTSSRFNYSYIANANRIFGDGARRRLSGSDASYSGGEDRPAATLGNHRHNTHLLRAEFNEWDYSRWIGYGYLIDNRDMPAVSNRTLGVKYQFNYHSGGWRYRLDAEVALQQLTESAESARPGYGLLELTLGHNNTEVLLRQEILGSSRGRGFVTPLGSGYRFQGFADRFIVTPANGVHDTSLGVNWRARPWRIQGRYHHFTEASGSSRYGDEFNLDITFRPVREHSVMLRYANFRAADDFVDTLGDRHIVYLDYSYNF